MKTRILIMAAFLTLAAMMAKAQKSTASFCKYKGGQTEVKQQKDSDKHPIFYQTKQVGFISCQKFKQKGGGALFENIIYDNSGNEVATVSSQTGQMVITYKDPFKVVYIKGMSFNNVIKQMVEVDKRLNFQ